MSPIDPSTPAPATDAKPPKRPRVTAAQRAARALAEQQPVAAMAEAVGVGTPSGPAAVDQAGADQPAAVEVLPLPPTPAAIPVAPGATLVAVSTLAPYARNARTHSLAQVRALAESIRAFGLAGALVVRDGTIAKGHGTLAACQLLWAAGEAVYPVPGRDGGAAPYPQGYLPVQDATGWTKDRFRGFVIADNQHAQAAGWDLEILALEVADLRALEVPLGMLGLDDMTLQTIFGDDAVQPLDGMPSLPDGDRSDFREMTFSLHHEQAEIARKAIKQAIDDGANSDTRNPNSNGNALAFVCADYLRSHRA